MYVKDLDYNEYVTQMTYQIDEELNGNKVLSAVIKPTKPNLFFLDKLAEMWTLIDDDETSYKIVFVKKQGEGKLLSAEIRAIPSFYDDFDNDRVYEEYNRSLTAKAVFDIIFAGSGYFYQLHGDYTSQDWEGFGGGATRLEMFQDALNRYGAEFTVLGQTVSISKQIGEDTNIMYRHRLNASNIVQETDASGFWTFAKGYGDYEGDKESSDWKDAKLIREYTSPIANIPGIGKRHAPPIKNGRVKNVSVMEAHLKKVVDESLKISVTADIHDLTRQGYPIAHASLGDRAFLIDERIGLDVEVRIVDKKLVRDWRGEILDIQLTLGSQDITKRHQSNLNSAVKAVTDLFEGKKKLPLNALASEVANVTKAILSAQTELDFTNGIIARDPENPNLVVMLTSAGLGVSQDGGRTFKNAITGRGILAEHILAGTITAGGAHRIDIADGSILSYVSNKLTMSFGRYQMDFYHPDGSLIGNFGPGNIVGTDIPGLRLMLARNQGYFNIGHEVAGVVRPTYRTFSYDGNHYTFIAGPYADNTEAGIYASSKIWESSRPRNQAATLYGTANNHSVRTYFGRNDSDGEYRILHNRGDDAYTVAYFDKDKFWSKMLEVGSNVKIKSSTNAARFGVNENTYIAMLDNGRVNFVVNGVVKHTFSPDG